MKSSAADPQKPRLGHDSYNHPLRPQTAIGRDPIDGLPRVTSAVSMEDSKAPPLSLKNLVCMGDESVFVVRDLWDKVQIEFAPERVRRSDDEYFVARGELSETELKALGIVERELRDIGALRRNIPEPQTPWLKVWPLRPQCHYYKRLMTDFEGDAEHSSVERVCTAQRSEEGEYFSVGNVRILACEHRVPRDFVSEERLREFDKRAIQAAEPPKDDWDIDQALDEQEEDTPPNG